jgi:hypothetical protein
MSLLLENHIKNNGWGEYQKPCSCSYCVGNHKLHYGLNIPKNWTSWNSWWVIKYGDGKYIRWTHPFLRYIKKKKQ